MCVCVCVCVCVTELNKYHNKRLLLNETWSSTSNFQKISYILMMKAPQNGKFSSVIAFYMKTTFLSNSAHICV